MADNTTEGPTQPGRTATAQQAGPTAQQAGPTAQQAGPTAQQAGPATQQVTMRPDQQEERDESVDHPTKLLRIAAMSRTMLQELRQDSLDQAARERLARIHNTSVSALREVVSDELRAELDEVGLPVETDQDVPSEAELRVAHAQLVGWLEGLFHGIQASLATQQMAAQEQLQRIRQRALGRGEEPGPSGQYL